MLNTFCGNCRLPGVARAKPDDELYFELKGKVKEPYRLGDCVAPRFVDYAIWEGEKTVTYFTDEQAANTRGKKTTTSIRGQ